MGYILASALMTGEIMARVLIIDDDEMCSEAIRRSLEILGNHEVSWAADGEAGLIAARNELPDIILLDMLMPKMNGYEVLKELKDKQSTLNIPVIILSAIHDDQTIKEMMLEYDANYVVKPVDAHALINTIRHVLSCANNQ